MHRWSILIIVQLDVTQSSLFIILHVHSTCLGCQPHPSSEVHKTVTTAFGNGLFFVQLPPSNLAKLALVAAQRIWPVVEAVVTVLCTPDDGCSWHPKHVEWTCRKIDCFVLHLVGQLIYYNIPFVMCFLTQKKAYNIQNTAKFWNQEHNLCLQIVCIVHFYTFQLLTQLFLFSKILPWSLMLMVASRNMLGFWSIIIYYFVVYFASIFMSWYHIDDLFKLPYLRYRNSSNCMPGYYSFCSLYTVCLEGCTIQVWEYAHRGATKPMQIGK